jgi:hypothetical protein
VFTNITESKKAEQEIYNLAFLDSLTGLPNRRLLQDRVNVALSASGRNKMYGALLFIDLDNFIFHKTPGNNYGGIDEYSIDKFKGNELLYNENPIQRGNLWYGLHPNVIVYHSFSDTYGISDKIIETLKINNNTISKNII